MGFGYSKTPEGNTAVSFDDKVIGHIIPVGTGAYFQSTDKSIKTRVFVDFLTCRKFVENI
jgi:hypothetical protein